MYQCFFITLILSCDQTLVLLCWRIEYTIMIVINVITHFVLFIKNNCSFLFDKSPAEYINGKLKFSIFVMFIIKFVLLFCFKQTTDE